MSTTVDGARQTTSSYRRGYSGNRDEVYVDPDMIGGIDISKGPSKASAPAPSQAPSISVRSRRKDIIKDGNNYGVRFKEESWGQYGYAPRCRAGSATTRLTRLLPIDP